jgi:hypothetical protein
VPRVSNTTTPRTTRTTGTTGANATTNTNAANNATPSAPAFAPPPLRSTSGSIIPTNRAVIDGLAGGTMNATSTASRSSRDASFDGYTATGTGAVNRAFIRTSAEAIPGGARVRVQSFHARKSDKVTLWLVAEVLDVKTKQLRTITLSTLGKSMMLNKGSYRGDNYFDVSYDEVNKFLQAKNPNLKLNPGFTSLAVSARWSNGHQAGGFGRGGVFRLPPSGSTTSVIGVRTGRGTLEEPDLPLDMQVAYPAALTRSAKALKPDGDILSRLESELKGTASKQEMTSAVTKMYDLAEKAQNGDKAAVEKALGKGWTISTVNRYWIKDDGSANQAGKPGTGFFKGFRVDDDGLPIQDPMKDVYMDDRNLGMTRLEGAIRLRTNKQATNINVKPGGGREDDKTGIRQRIEYGLELKPGSDAQDAARTLQTLSRGQWSGSVFNMAQREVAKLPGDVVLSYALEPWLEVTQDRHKFMIANEAGVEIEFSFDKVKTKTTRPGMANADGTAKEAEFYVLEAELDHLQLTSSNASTYQAGGARTSYFTRDSDQNKWLDNTSDQVTMDIDPRLHELKDLDNKSFRATGSYQDFETSAAKVIPWLFPNGLGHGRQKAAHAADVLGLVMFDDKKLKAAVMDVFDDNGYALSANQKKKLDKMFDDPRERLKLEQNLVNGNQNNPYRFAQYTFGESGLKYVKTRMKKRLKEKLHSLGYESSAKIEDMLDKLTPQKVRPYDLESYFSRMQNASSDANVLHALAKDLGISQVPVPKQDIARILGPSTTSGRLLRQGLAKKDIDASQAPEIEKFFEDAAKAGADVSSIRTAMADLGRSPTSTLNKIAKQTNGAVSAPVLRHDPAALLQDASKRLSKKFVAVDDGIKKLVDQVAKKLSHKEARSFLTKLSRDTNKAVADVAADLGISAPTVNFDTAAIDTHFTAKLDDAQVKDLAAMKKFFRNALIDGASVSKLDKVVRELQSNPDLKRAFERQKLNTTGVSFPTVKYDDALTYDWADRTLKKYGDALDTKTEVRKWMKDQFAKGRTPQQLVNYLSYAIRYGRAYGSRYINGMSTRDGLPVSEKNIMASIEKKYGRQWSQKHEDYFKKALPRALKKQDFRIGRMFESSYYIGYEIERHSGLRRPSGVR